MYAYIYMYCMKYEYTYRHVMKLNRHVRTYERTSGDRPLNSNGRLLNYSRIFKNTHWNLDIRGVMHNGPLWHQACMYVLIYINPVSRSGTKKMGVFLQIPVQIVWIVWFGTKSVLFSTGRVRRAGRGYRNSVCGPDEIGKLSTHPVIKTRTSVSII